MVPRTLPGGLQGQILSKKVHNWMAKIWNPYEFSSPWEISARHHRHSSWNFVLGIQCHRKHDDASSWCIMMMHHHVFGDIEFLKRNFMKNGGGGAPRSLTASWIHMDFIFWPSNCVPFWTRFDLGGRLGGSLGPLWGAPKPGPQKRSNKSLFLTSLLS